MKKRLEVLEKALELWKLELQNPKITMLEFITYTRKVSKIAKEIKTLKKPLNHL